MDTTTHSAAADSQGGRRDRYFPFLLVAAGALAIFYGLGRVDISSDNEGQRGTPPIEMLQTGDFIVPTINRHVYIVKPPLLYWAIAGLYRVTGVISETTARTPTALSGVALLLCVYVYARRSLGERAGRRAGIMLLAMPLFLFRSQVSDLDMPLTLACFGTIVGMWSAMDGGRRPWAMAVAAGGAFGAAILLKGPVPFLFVVSAWVVHMVVRGEHWALRIRTALVWTAVLFAGDWLVNGVQWMMPADAPAIVHRVLAPPYGLIGILVQWLWLAWRGGPADRARRAAVLAVVLLAGVALAAPWFVVSVFRLGWDYWRELLNDQAIGRTYNASRINSGSHLFYAIALSYCMAPWSLLMPLVFSSRLRAGASPAWTASGLAALLSIVVFSLIAGKEEDYVLPAYPFAAIALAGVLASAEARPGGWTDRYRHTWSALTLVLLAMGAVAVASYAAWSYAGETAAHMELWIGAAVALGAAWACRLRKRRITGVAIATIAVMTQLHIVDGVHSGGRRSIQDVAVAMRQLREQGLRVEASKVRPATAFYLRTPIAIVDNPQSVAERLRGGEPYYYLCRGRELEGLRAAAGDGGFQLLADWYTPGRYTLIGNRALPEGVRRNLSVDGGVE